MKLNVALIRLSPTSRVRNCERGNKLTDWKWLMYRNILRRSATMVYPLTCMRSSPLDDVRFPVAKNVATRCPMLEPFLSRFFW